MRVDGGRAARGPALLRPGTTVRVRVPALKPGTYDFVDDDYEATAKGRIIAE